MPQTKTDRLLIAPQHRRILEDLLSEHLPGVEVWAYGSRVNGLGHDGSDLDLVLRAPDLQNLPSGQLLDFEDAIRKSTIPFLVEARDWACLPERFHREIEREYVELAGTIKVPAPLVVGTLNVTSQSIGSASDWGEVVLGDCVVINDSTYSPKEAWKRINYLDTGSITENRIFEIRELEFGKHKIPSRARRKVRPGDILYSTVRPDQRHFGLLKSVPENFLASTAFAVLRGKDGITDPGFIYWFLAQDHIVEYLHSIAENSTSAYPSIKPRDLEQLYLSLPPLSEQRAIAHILGTLDDKIELNRRMNRTLEGMAQALFRAWFVDFDPVKAKMEGRDTGLPKEIADLFPDRLVDSELGEIPEGWPVESLADHFEAVKGVSYKGSGLGRDGTPLHNLNSVYEGGGYKYEGIKFYSGEYTERHRVRPGDVIVANTEQGHDRLLIGYAAVVPALFGTDGIASHHIYRLRSRPASGLTTRFLLFLLNSARMHDLVSGYANGTTVNMLPIDGVQRPPIAVPPRALVEAFDLVASQSEHRREQTVRESRTLAVLRDTLLPKLVSGELRVPGQGPAGGHEDHPATIGAHEA